MVHFSSRKQFSLKVVQRVISVIMHVYRLTSIHVVYGMKYHYDLSSLDLCTRLTRTMRTVPAGTALGMRGVWPYDATKSERPPKSL